MNRVKIKPTKWEKILASYSSTRGLTSRRCKDHKKLNTRANNPTIKWANELKRQFSKEVQWPINTRKKCSTSLSIREIQIKTKLIFSLTSVRMAISSRK
jgi:hypothetical protein